VKILKKYKISNNTLAIISMGDNNSLIYEVDKVIVINKNPNYIIKSNILIDGSTYDVRMNYVKNLTGYVYKAPVLIDSKNNIVFFPTCSPRLKSVSWFNINSIDNVINDIKNNRIIIKLINGNNIYQNVSIYTFNNQILRASRYEHLLRKNEV